MGDENKYERTEQDFYIRVLREMDEVRGNPRLLVLVSHGFIELIANALINLKCKNKKYIKNVGRFSPTPSSCFF